MKMIATSLFVLLSTTSFAQTLKTNLISFTNADSHDEARVERALELIEEVVNSDAFRNKVLNMTYKGWFGRTYSGFTQTNLTRAQVLTSILKAEENFEGGKPQQIDYFLDMYNEDSNVIGYTSVNDKFIHMNRFFHQDYTPIETAGNLFHEWLHKIGHDHSFYNNSKRPDSVPYKLGYLMADMAADIESNGDPLLKEMMIDDFTGHIDQCAHGKKIKVD